MMISTEEMMSEPVTNDPAGLAALQALKDEITTAAICGTSRWADAVAVLLEGAADLLTLQLGAKDGAASLLAIATKWQAEADRITSKAPET
jgi:hypothetical protein